MRKLKLSLAAAVVVAAGALAAPATSSAQGTDVGQLCHSLLGSGTTVVGPVALDRCLASTPPKCTLTDTYDILGLVRIRLGLLTCVEENGAGVRGVITIRLI